MLPAEHRLTRPADFSATVRDGVRAGRRRVVVHVRHRAGEAPSEQRPGPVDRAPGASSSALPVRVGLVVGKSVGGAVVRHGVARRLRHVSAPIVADLPGGTDVVLRALGPAAGATSAELAGDVRSALVRLGFLAGDR